MWDGSIALARVGGGIPVALSSHYTTPQTFVLSGVLMFALVQLSYARGQHRFEVSVPVWRGVIWFGFIALGLILAAVVITSANVGINDARTDNQVERLGARVVVNLDRLSVNERACYLDAGIEYGFVPVAKVWKMLATPISDLRTDRLSIFSAPDYQRYRKLGPPVFSFCNPH